MFSYLQTISFQIFSVSPIHQNEMDVEDESLNHFLKIPWCHTILSSPQNTVTPTQSRILKSNDEDSLMSTSLKTAFTISQCVSFYPTHSASVSSSSPDLLHISSLSTIYQLGKDMNGGPNMLHGGIIATLLDDTIGTLLTVNKTPKGDPLSRKTVTAELKVGYKRPVFTPSVVMCVVRVVKRVGRKVWFEGELLGEFEEEGGRGSILARCESMWVVIEPKL
jgi:acyl-coenzyme A thioesterase PaaI-like protein